MRPRTPLVHCVAVQIARVVLFAAATIASAQSHAAQLPATSLQDAQPLRLAGHVLPALQRAVAANRADSGAPIVLTLVLNRADEAGFQQYLHDVYDPASPNVRHFLTTAQIAQRFGPSQQDYDRVAAFLAAQNLALIAGSDNRMTLTVSGARADVERAFAVHIGDFALDAHTFYANTDAPALPAEVGAHVNAVLGLSSLAQATRSGTLSQGTPKPDDDPFLARTCKISAELDTAEERIGFVEKLTGIEFKGSAALSVATTILHYQCAADELDLVAAYAANAGGAGRGTLTHAAQASGSGQKIGLVEFDSYNNSDVLAYLNFIGYPQRLAQLSYAVLGAGPDFTMQGESEVLLDIDTVLTLAPGANVVTYEAGFQGQGSFQTMFNSMIGGGVNVISNSWAYCEDQTTLADVQSLDAVLQTAAAAGITVLSAAGDSGSTCLDGSANTIAVPADAPTITAVGGTSAQPGVDGTYGSETWWDGSQQTPATGQGGFGTSRFFARPAYQNAVNAQANRAIPDVSAPADPAQGVLICQADNGGCPGNLLYGGTSIAAPIWAAAVAVLNQRAGTPYGFLNPQLYPLANGNGFHAAASMGSDFAHVGLGSPNFGELRRLIAGGTTGSVALSNSTLIAYPPQVYADGASQAGVSAILFDANFNIVANQNVTLAANVGSHATIGVINASSSVSNGAARFTISDNTAETVTLTAHVGGNAIAQTAQVIFVGAPATAGGIVAAPTTQTADGTSISTVTVSLQDAQHRPAAGKLVLLTQSGNSVILGANPRATDVNGEAQFDATDQVQETVVYSAVDASDNNLAVPLTANVDFNNALANSCGNGAMPLAGPGYAISVYASGFPVSNGVLFGGITLSGCVGVGGIAFDAAQNLFVSDYVTGDVYKFASGGGVASAANRVTTAPIGPSLGGLAFSAGKLYGTRVATSVNATTGAVLSIDTGNGAASVIAPNLPCPSNLATDPLSGDLFVTDFCFNGTQEDDSIVRIANPGGASPATSTYAHSGIAPNGSVAFSPDGTLYVVYGYTNFGGLFSGIARIGASNGTQPAPVTVAGVSSSFAALPLGTNPAGGGAQSIVTSVAGYGGYAHSVAVFDMTLSPAAYSGTTLVQTDIGSAKILGPDGCLYFGNGNAVYKLTNANGTCPLNGLAPNPSVVLSPDSDPNAAVQGTPLRFDVLFPHNPDLPFGTPVMYEISGVNATVGTTGVGFGTVSFSYTGRHAGRDSVVASAVINGSTVQSSPVTVTWAAGKHETFIDLDTSAVAGTQGGSQLLSGSLLDVSLTPFAPIAGATLQLAVAGQACNAITDAGGHASCRVAMSGRGECTLTATYAGSTQYLAASASQLFAVSSTDVLFANGFELTQGNACSL